MMKICNKLGIEGNYYNIVKAILENPTAYIILNGETESFSSRIKNKIKIPTFATSTQHDTRSSSQSN